MLEDAIIPEEVPIDDIEIVEELPGDIGLDAIEEPIIDDNDENGINIEEEPAEILLEEDPADGAEITGLIDENEQISGDENNEAGAESDPKTNEEEILYNLEKIAISAEVTQSNVKTGIENLQLLSTCSLSVTLMLLGGFVIYCFVNRLG